MKQKQYITYKQKGVSLLELMVSMTIGILLLLGLGGLYQVANQTNRDIETLSSNAEAARQVFWRLETDLKKSGYVDLYSTPVANFAEPAGSCVASTPVPIDQFYGSRIANLLESDTNKIYLRLIDSKTPGKRLDNRLLTAIGSVSCGKLTPVFGCGSEIDGVPSSLASATCSDVAANSASQSIEIAYQGMKTGASALSSLPENDVRDCAGREIAANTTNGFVVNRYFLAADEHNNGEMSLKCRGNGGSPGSTGNQVTLVPGIVEMVFRYVNTVAEGDESANVGDTLSGKVVTRYTTASQILGENRLEALGWSGVVGVEVCIVVATRSFDGTLNTQLAAAQGDTRPSCVRDSSGNLTTSNDKTAGRYYDRYIRTLSLPNSLYAPQ